ncbi:hypothetical protein Tco_0327739 [Tanacetum coccineum]
MSSSTIHILADSTSESVGSATSLVILSDTETKVMTPSTVLPVIAPEADAAMVASPTAGLDFVLESDPPTAPLLAGHAPVSSAHVPASSDDHVGLASESEPFEDPSKDNAPKTATSTPPADLAPTPRIIPHDASLSTWYPLLPLELSSSPSKLSSSSSSSSESSSSSSKTSPSSEISLHSSSGTSHTPPGPLPHRRHQLSSYSTPSSVSVRPSCKRCKPPTTSPQAVALVSPVLSSIPADRLSPCKRFRGSPAASLQEDTIEATTLRDRVASSKGENIILRKRVRVMELGDESLRVSLRTTRTRHAKIQRQVRDTTEDLRQSHIACLHDRERIKMIEAYSTMSTTNQGMSSTKIEHIVAQRATDAIEAIAIYETKTHVALESMD